MALSFQAALLLPTTVLLLWTVLASGASTADAPPASTATTTTTTTTTTSATHREHKVHNIVLYPDKHSWCRTTTIKQVISYPGCQPVEIDNNVCVGACFSYSIPHTEPSDPGEVIVPYCDSCQPAETAWHNVTLDCSGAAAAAPSSGAAPPVPAQFVKRVQIITNCSCAPCDRSASMINHSQPKAMMGEHQAAATGLPSLGDDLQHDEPMSNDGGPDLLNELQRRNESSSSLLGGGGRRPEGLRLLMDNRIVELLQRIQETNQPEDRQQLKTFLEMIQEPLEQDNNNNDEQQPLVRWSDAEFDRFLERLTDEHVELDTERLHDVLHVFERTQQERHLHQQQLMDKHLHDKQQHQLERQLEQQQQHHQFFHHAAVPNTVGAAAAAAGVAPSIERRPQSENFTNRTSEPANATESTLQHHHHHVVGEHLGAGRLVKGPHGALVVQPDAHDDADAPQHERRRLLEVNPIELKANHAGTMLSYGHDPPPPPPSDTIAATVDAAAAAATVSTEEILVAPSIVQHQQQPATSQSTAAADGGGV